MLNANVSTIEQLTLGVLGAARSRQALGALVIDPALLKETGGQVSRAAFAMALNVVLFDDLLARVPSGGAYVAERLAQGQRVHFDHGALRTIRFPSGPTGALPGGADAFRRILEPLGYSVAGTYPLPALKMTGYAFAQADLPEAIPQFFVSELHIEAFDSAFEAAAHRVFDSTREPLDDAALSVLAALKDHGRASVSDAAQALTQIAQAFGRHHGPVALADYEILLAQSAEAAWIATEGSAFNHATDRVDDVEALAEALKAGGHPMKARLEISTSGRVRQTALRADPVERRFVSADGEPLTRQVPGSFYEFISRDPIPETGQLDLAFDSGNATGIFAMTRKA